MIDIVEVKTQQDYMDFVELAFDIYKNEKYWVAPIKKDYFKYIQGRNNELRNFPHKLFLAKKDKKILGRVIAFIDTEVNKIHNISCGYLAEYEAYNDLKISRALFDAAFSYFKDNGITIVKGPSTIPGGEDKRGLMLNSFNSYPSIMNTYNLEYYNDQFLDYGFTKYHDTFAYSSTKEDLEEKISKLEELIPRIEDRYSYRVDFLDLKNNLERDLNDIYKILEKSIPSEWEDFKPVSRDEIFHEFQLMKPFILKDIVAIARNEQNDPIGFALALPDYNEILKDFKGKLGLINIIKFLLRKNKIKRVRMFVLFVVPEYRNKGVSSAIYYRVFQNSVARGFTELEGSTIWDYNNKMILDIEKFGGKKSITYRIYKKEILKN